MHILELWKLWFLSHRYSIDKNNLFIEGSPLFLRPSVEVVSETGAVGLFLCLCVLMAICPLFVTLSEGKSSKITAVLLPNS